MKAIQLHLAEDIGYTDKDIFVDNAKCPSLSAERFLIRVSYFDGIEDNTIDEHTDRLAEALDRIAECSGAERFDIIAHSMGGVVARNYISRRDSYPIDKVVLIGTPNYGGLYNHASIANLFAEKWQGNSSLDFMELSEKTGFMRTLNDIPIYSPEPNATQYFSIAGNIDGKGDGTVLEQSAHLAGVIGKKTVNCSHSVMLSPLLCPEAYEYMLEVLEPEQD